MNTEIIKRVVTWLVTTFGKDLAIVLKDKIQHHWRRMFASRNILILGPKQSGKSSLLQYLTSGHPYELVNGEMRPPAPTALAAVVDKKFSLQQGNWLRLKRDVPGDLDLRDTWAQAISDIRPHGIIYMIDGRHSDDQIRDEVTEIREFVLANEGVSNGQFATIHVFVNFSDHWATTAHEQHRRICVAREALESIAIGNEKWGHLRLGVAATQLSPNKKSWEDADRALNHFGADLLA